MVLTLLKQLLEVIFIHLAIPSIPSLLTQAGKGWNRHMDENHFRDERVKYIYWLWLLLAVVAECM